MLNHKERSLLYGANFWYFGEGLLGPLFAVFAERIGGDVLDIAWAWAAYMIVTGVMTIIVGRLSDRLVRKEFLLIVGYAANALLTFAYLFVSTPLQLLWLQVGLGIAVAMATPTWDALYAKYEDRRHAGFTWGIADGEAQIMLGISAVVGGLIVNGLSFEVLFIAMGIIQVIATLVQMGVLIKKIEFK